MTETQTLYAAFAAKIDAALAALEQEARAAAAARRAARSASSRRAIPRTATSPPTPRWCWPSPPATNPRALAEQIVAQAGRRSAGRRAPRSPGPGFINLRLADASWLAELRAIAALGADYGRSAHGRRADGQRRIRLGQPDRADAHGPLPRRGGRRRARRAARVRRARGDPRILRQRRRRRRSDARPLGAPALPRGARRGRSARSPKGSIRATTWSRSARRWPPSSATATSPRPRANGSTCSATRAVAAMMEMIRADLALLGIHHDVFSSEAELQARGQARGGRSLAARARPGLRRRARSAQGQDARGLGAGRAAAVPLDPVRRRPGPPDPQERRQLDLFRRRPRLSHAEGRRAPTS